MAGDPRESSSSQEPGSHLPASIPNTDPKKPKHDFPQSQVGKLWDAFGNPEEPVNALANATYKPRGKDPKDVSYSEVVGTISVSEISSFYKVPCARESLLTGIGAGFGIGGTRAVFGGMCIHSSIAKLNIYLIFQRNALIMVCRKLGSWSVRSHLSGSIRVLSTTPDPRIAWNERSSRTHEGIEGKETTGQGKSC